MNRPAVQTIKQDVKHKAKQTAKDGGRQAKPWALRLMRLGLVAKGVVYATIGLLAVMTALPGPGGETTDTQGALEAIAEPPAGKVLLAVLALGLVGYLMWRLTQAIADPGGIGNDAKGFAKRGGYAVSGLIHGALAVTAVLIIFRGGTGPGGDTERSATALLLEQPFGQWLVGVVGLTIAGLGLYQVYRAFTCTFATCLRRGQMPPAVRRSALVTGSVGHAARGVVFGVMGVFFVQAALSANPEETRGIGDALATIQTQPFGPWLLGAVAAGFLSYGVYMTLEARYREVFAE